MRAILAAAALSAALSACQTTPEVQMVWIRTDGQPIKGNAALEQQYETDSTICMGEASKTALGISPTYTGGGLAGAIERARIQHDQEQGLILVARGCMAERGYAHVPEPDVAKRQEEYRKTAKSR